ncbi:MAG: hypothetical protein HY243_03115 [Proteobacteria bacterium]|nr:hypothetical protein [Pseudomonadota bacterium]
MKSDVVNFIHESEADYRKASFLDARLLEPPRPTRPLHYTAVEAATASLAERCHFIFHIGHVGSTLLSRLIGEHPRAFSLREPLPLRALAQLRIEPETAPRPWSEGEYDKRTGTFLKLWSRTFSPAQQPVVKATSFVCEIASSLLSRAYKPKAIFMFAPAEVYLATILGGANSRQEARMLAPLRLRRLHKRLGGGAWTLSALSEGEMIAMSWACEMAALTEAARVAPGRVMWIDFNDFLAIPGQYLKAVFRRLDIEASDEEVQRIAESDEMRRYSKAPEHSYDAKLRRDVLNQAREQFEAEIGWGLNWIERAAGEFPLLKEVWEGGR